MAKTRQIVECVPNFSEGRDKTVIKQITDVIEKSEGVKLLDVDPGEATNRTVVTFVGEPDAVVEAAFKAVKKAGEVIDMRHHHGAHPRMGATDVCPLVPVSGITLEECAELARKLAERIANEIGIPCYCYEAAALKPERPIAFDVREKGRPEREGNPITGTIKRDADGKPIMRPGTLKGTKAIGWFIKEYGIAQVSMNITDINATPLHVAFDEVCRAAQARGLRVTGTEIVGLVPERAVIDASKYFLRKQHRSTGIPKEDILNIAIKSMGLDDLRPFVPEEKVIEYLLDADNNNNDKLTALTVRGFADETLRESPAPGGGSVAAYMGALGAALGTMVANLSAHKPGWDDRWDEFSQWADRGLELETELLHLVDEDTEAFNRIMAAFGMPKNTEEDKRLRSEAIQSATLFAAQVPLETMKTSFKAFEICKAMAETGNPNSVSDAGVGALAARAAVLGAGLNVKINASSLKDKLVADGLVAEAEKLMKDADAAEREIMTIVENTIKK